jgi:hypothetical protein
VYAHRKENFNPRQRTVDAGRVAVLDLGEHVLRAVAELVKERLHLRFDGFVVLLNKGKKYICVYI